MLRNLLLVGGVSLFLVGCYTRYTPPDYTHPSYGIVKFEHPAFAQDRDACDQTVYGVGISVFGKTVYNRSDAVSQWVETILRALPIDGGTAGMQAAIAVKTGDMSQVTATNKPPPLPRDRNYGIANSNYWDCVRSKGWTPVKKTAD